MEIKTMLLTVIIAARFLFPLTSGNTSTDTKNNSVNDTVSVMQFGAKGDGKTDDSQAFQAAMDTRKVVIVPATSKYYYIGKTVRVYNSVIGLRNPVLQSTTAALSDQPKTAKTWGKFMIFHIGNKLDSKTLTIANMTFKGAYRGGKLLTEHNHLLSIASSNHIKVINNTFINAPGDAISINYFNYQYEKYQQSFASFIEISNNKIVNPYRCGIAIISGKNVKIVHNDISKYNNYVNAIDLEPEHRGDVDMFAQTVVIDQNSITAPSTDIAINIVGARNYNTANVSVFNNQITAKKTAIRVASTQGVVSDVNIRANRFTAPQFLLFKPGNKYFEKVSVLDNVQVIDYAIFGSFSKINGLKIINNISRNTSNNFIIHQCNDVEVYKNELLSTTTSPIMLTSNSAISNYNITQNKVSTPLPFVSIGYKGTKNFSTKNINVSENHIRSKEKNVIRSFIKNNNILHEKNTIN